MNILILGSEGLIGKSLCTILQNHHYTVTRWDIKLDPKNHDLTKGENVPGLQKAVDASDFVFFLAYDVGGAKYLSNVDTGFIDRNSLLMMHTFSTLKNKPFVFASSTMRNMDNAYGTLKYIGEHYTNILGGLSVRLWNVYGPEPYSEKSHVVTDMIHSLKTKGFVDLMTSGEEERQFLHVDDCSECLLRVMREYHIIRETETSVDISSFEWIRIKDLATYVSKDIRTTDIRRTNHDRQNEPRRFMRMFWHPKISLREGIASCLQ